MFDTLWGILEDPPLATRKTADRYAKKVIVQTADRCTGNHLLLYVRARPQIGAWSETRKTADRYAYLSHLGYVHIAELEPPRTNPRIAPLLIRHSLFLCPKKTFFTYSLLSGAETCRMRSYQH